MFEPRSPRPSEKKLDRIQLNVKFTQEELTEISKRAAELDLNRSDFVRLCIAEHFEKN